MKTSLAPHHDEPASPLTPGARWAYPPSVTLVRVETRPKGAIEICKKLARIPRHASRCARSVKERCRYDAKRLTAGRG